MLTTAVTMSALSSRKTNKMQQQQMQQQQTQQANYATAPQSAATVEPDVVAPTPVQQEVQPDQIRTIASAISLYRKKGLNYAEIFTKVEAYNKGYKNEDDFKEGYLAFVNEEAISNAKWEKVLEFELEHQE